MKKILYLLCSCFAVTLMASCEDFLDKTPQGDKTDQDIFSRFNETESLINRLYFYARAADQPLSFNEIFSHFGRTVPLVITAIISMVLIYLGMILLLIPGIKRNKFVKKEKNTP